jgi:CRP-like cAMP-binding protein
LARTLKGHELFQSLSVEEVGKISDFSELKEFQKDEFVFKSGTVGSHCFVVLEGSVRLRLPTICSEAGLVIAHIEKGDMFGLAPLLDAGEHTTSAQCAEPSKVLAIEAEPLRALLQKNCPVGSHVANSVAQAYFSRYVKILNRLQRAVDEIATI